MLTRARVLLVCAAAAVAAVLPASRAAAAVVTFEDFESGAATGHMFRQPSFSGSTDDNLNGFGATITPNIQRATATFPAGLPTAGTQVGETQFQFLDASTSRWLRHTTSGAPGRPNPLVKLNEPLSFDVYSTVPVSVSLLIRETGGTGPLGANGGTTGGIEYVGATSFAGSPGGTGAGPVGKAVPANQWTTLTFDIGSEPVTAFAGASANGVLTGDWGVLEALAITCTGNAGPVTMYYDNFRQGVVPEPATLGVLGVAALALLARCRRVS